MKDITPSEVDLRDEVAMRLLATIAGAVKGPDTLKSAIASCYDVAEHFIRVRRAVQAVDKDGTDVPEPVIASPLVKS